MKKEKKAISKEVLWIIIGTVVAVIALGAVAFWGLNQDFKADKYVGVILDYTFKGEADDTDGMFDPASHEQMKKQYDENIAVFVENNITGGIAVDDEMKEKYTALCKDIFKAMKYNVKTVEKVNRDEYKVTVEYETANIFGTYMELATQEAGKLLEKANRGEYQGTKDEINAQMQQETIVNDYTVLESAYQNVQYAEKEKFVFTVKRAESEAFALDGAELSEFLAKIMDLDAKED
jgi:hypothetical protein